MLFLTVAYTCPHSTVKSVGLKVQVNLIRSVFLLHISADLTKGSFGHFSSFYVILISETSKISIFCMFLQESQIASNM